MTKDSTWQHWTSLGLKAYSPMYPASYIIYTGRQNILLDSMLNAVIADFGFVTPLPTTVGSTSLVTAAGALTLAWSRGYLAPEITDGKHGVFSDVYSYRVVGRCECKSS